MAAPIVLSIMKSLKNRLALLSVLLAFPFSLSAGTLQTVTLQVENMTCSICPITVKKALEKVPGVASATVNFDRKQAKVTFDDSLTTVDQLREATANSGYPSALADTNSREAVTKDR
jgi:mercuric ion binding protein